MLKPDYVLQIMNQIDHYQKENSSKIFGFRANTCSHLTERVSEDKKVKGTENCYKKKT